MTPESHAAAEELTQLLTCSFRDWVDLHPTEDVQVALNGLLHGTAEILGRMISHGHPLGGATAAIDEFLEKLRTELVSREP